MAYTTIDDPSKHFQAQEYTGTGATQSVVNDGNSNLKPDWVWIGGKASGDNNSIFDSTRGATKELISNGANAEATDAQLLTQFDTDGFTVGTNGGVNGSGDGYIAWQWKANGGTTSTNTNGTVNSTVQANTTAGFSIVKWASDGAPDTIGHGLNQAPDWIFMKSTVSGLHWFGYSRNLGAGKQHLLALNYIQSNTSVLNNTDPSSTVFYTNHNDVSSGGMIAYCFHEVQGYSKFGQYHGNGSSSNGPLVYLGFKPALFIIRRDGSANWLIFDIERSINLNDNYIYANSNSAEGTSSSAGVDFLSNGVKIRNTYNDGNASGAKYVYMAFAHNPFVTSTGIPTTAR